MSTDLDRRYTSALPPADDYRGGRSIETAVALDFADEAVREAQTSRRHAWLVTALLIVICGAQAAAIAVMLPLKEVVPYTILVDRQTGYVETTRGVELGTLKDDHAVVESFLAQYVLQRETFDPADFNERYARVALWSAGQARADYVASYKPGAPDSIFASVRPGTVIGATVKNIEVLTANTARVRYTLSRRDPGAAPVNADWQALVSFRFTGAPMKMEDRLINPLGFQVTAFRRDGEWGTPAPPLAPAPLVAPAPTPTIVTTPAPEPPRPQPPPTQARVSPAPSPPPRAVPTPPHTSIGPTP